MLSRRTILLKPMQPGLSGYARLQTEGARTVLQLHARGLEEHTPVRLYWYLSGQRAQELSQGAANAHGEVSVEADAPQSMSPQQLQAVLLIGGDPPAPLLIGLCAEQSAGSLMDAKNAALALCERLNRSRAAPLRPVSTDAPPAPAAPAPLPREVFLPAIDPAPYAQAADAPPNEAHEPMLPPPARSAPPVDRLRPLSWPRGFESLKPYFEKALPTALFDLPGWRFVYAAHAGGPNGLWIGLRQQDGQVRGIAYAHRGDAPPSPAKGYRALRGLDGQMYQVLWQNV